MKWNDVVPDISARVVDDLTKGWSAVDIVRLVSASKDTPLVVCSSEVREKILTHLTARNVELGGLLVGRVYSLGNLSEGVVAIEVVNAIPSDDYDSTSVSLSMNSSVWMSANEYTDSGIFVVGWYHSHPNLGAFFSGVDRKTQSDFFNHSYSLGLVIDPIRKEEKWFIGANSAEVNAQHIVKNI
jgi:proteasome lid subunit RPN8/RPN11